MEKRFELATYGSQLWAREKGKHIRGRLTSVLDKLAAGDVISIDAAGVEVFDFSFASEFFGKILSMLPGEYPGRFILVENLSDCPHENLEQALERLSLVIIERASGNLRLLGKVHPADQETFAAVVSSGEAVSAGTLSRKLAVNLTAMNERLAKLTSFSVVRREKGSSASGREQYVYRALN